MQTSDLALNKHGWSYMMFLHLWQHHKDKYSTHPKPLIFLDIYSWPYWSLIEIISVLGALLGFLCSAWHCHLFCVKVSDDCYFNKLFPSLYIAARPKTLWMKKNSFVAVWLWLPWLYFYHFSGQISAAGMLLINLRVHALSSVQKKPGISSETWPKPV